VNYSFHLKQGFEKKEIKTKDREKLNIFFKGLFEKYNEMYFSLNKCLPFRRIFFFSLKT
jgi:hypothetical protein